MTNLDSNLRQCDLISDFLTDDRIFTAEAVQISTGKSTFFVRQACGQDTLLTYLRASPKIFGHVIHDPKWLCLMIPIKWREDYFFNGISAKPGDVFLSAGSNGYATVGEGRETIALGIRRSRLDDTMVSLSGNIAATPLLSDQLARFDSTAYHHLKQGLLAAIRGTEPSPISAHRFALSHTVESDLYVLIANFVLAAQNRPDIPCAGRSIPFEVVALAKRALEAEPASSLADLCTSAGVGQSWLHKCFVEVTGESPYQHIRSRRLSAARDCLLSQGASSRLIKEIALNNGFQNFGRFAGDYRSRFGELPSQTRANANNLTARA